jgi:hypothetical protein
MVTNTFGKIGWCDAKVAMMQNKLLVRQRSNVYIYIFFIFFIFFLERKVPRKLYYNIYKYRSTKEHSSKLH